MADKNRVLNALFSYSLADYALDGHTDSKLIIHSATCGENDLEITLREKSSGSLKVFKIENVQESVLEDITYGVRLTCNIKEDSVCNLWLY